MLCTRSADEIVQGTLGAFLGDAVTKEIFRDRSIVKTLTFKAALLRPLIPKAEAVANYENWTFLPPISDDDDDPPEAPEAFPPCLADAEPLEEAVPKPPDAPATVSGGKRKSRAA